MGLCACCCALTISTAVGSCCSSGLTYCLKKNDNFTSKTRIQTAVVFGIILIIGLALYVALTFECANEDNDPWMLWKDSGACWTANNNSWLELGLFAGICIGIGLSGIVIVPLCGLCQKQKDETNNGVVMTPVVVL
eukprot:158529_1